MPKPKTQPKASTRQKRRKRYDVKETIIYGGILAHSEEEAEEFIASNPNRDKLVTSVEDREAYLP